jgi:hypothetical protein
MDYLPCYPTRRSVHEPTSTKQVAVRYEDLRHRLLTWVAGSLPDSWANMSQLQQLKLSMNNLTGEESH